ncbi:MAG TPA: molybdenum cofactor biosynthesis protein B [Nitrospiria bacterium]|nr:molybdenum cofactor biosynthesis protein B [Nitrospiria bacterium]
MGHKEHKEKSIKDVNCMVITVSDTRSEEEDLSGQVIIKMLKDNLHTVSLYRIVKDNPNEIKEAIELGCSEKVVQAIILNGGTGISKRDSTYEVVDGLLEKRLDGFGEIFRYLSYQEIGPSAVMSRAVAGAYKGRIIFSIPGSEGAVRLAMEKIILREMGHMVWEINR